MLLGGNPNNIYHIQVQMTSDVYEGMAATDQDAWLNSPVVYIGTTMLGNDVYISRADVFVRENK